MIQLSRVNGSVMLEATNETKFNKRNKTVTKSVGQRQTSVH